MSNSMHEGESSELRASEGRCSPKAFQNARMPQKFQIIGRRVELNQEIHEVDDSLCSHYKDGDERIEIRSELRDLEVEEFEGTPDHDHNRFNGDADSYYDTSGERDSR